MTDLWKTEEADVDAAMAARLLGVTLNDKGKIADMTKNKANRPFRDAMAKRYGQNMLRGKWEQNGEPILLDEDDNVISGQHRLRAIIWAQAECDKNPGKYGTEPISYRMVIISGIASDVSDTVDTGQNRTAADVLFRKDYFTIDQKEVAKVSGVLAAAARLVWLRTNGKVVRDAPKFDHQELISFVDEHEALKDWVKFVYDRYDEKQDVAGTSSKMTQLIRCGPLAGLMYLAAACDLDPDNWDGDLNAEMDTKAEVFLIDLMSATNLAIDSPILCLRKKLLSNEKAATKMSRDQLCSTFVKAWNFYLDGTKIKVSDLTLKKTEIDEPPRMGGLDVVESSS
jgi:hypothetical protein